MRIKAGSRHLHRVARIRDATGLALAWCSLLYMPHDSLATDLSRVFLEAKKPVEKQEAVHRASQSTPQNTSPSTQAWETTDEDSDPLAWVGMILDGLGEIQALLKDDTPASYGEAYPPPQITGAPLASTSGASVYAALKSLHVQPSDTALENLDGGGIEIGGVLASGLRMGVGLYSLRGEVLKSSLAYGGLTNAYEFAVDARARLPFYGSRFLSGFAGIRGGRLGWYYANPVFAIDDLGHGEEIWRDGLFNVSGYFGIGLTPIHTDFLEIGVDLGTGYREYFDESHEGFHNDVFAGGWFSQISVELALRF